MLSLRRRSPRYGMGMMNLRDDLHKMFRDFYHDYEVENRWLPSVDIIEDENTVILTAELPGVVKKDVKINLDKNTLTIQGEKKSSDEAKEDSTHRSERYYGKFTRSFTLNSEIDEEKIQADYKDGVLTISLPKSEKVKPRQITIS